MRNDGKRRKEWHWIRCVDGQVRKSLIRLNILFVKTVSDTKPKLAGLLLQVISSITFIFTFGSPPTYTDVMIFPY